MKEFGGQTQFHTYMDISTRCLFCYNMGVLRLVRRGLQNNRKVALVIPSLLPLGGVERVRLALAREIASNGESVDLIVLGDSALRMGVEDARLDDRQSISLLLPSLFPLGGAEHLTLRLASEFSDKDYLLDLVLCNEPDADSINEHKNVRLFDFGAPRMGQALWPFVRYLRRERPAVVLAAMWPLTCLAVVAAKIAGTGTRVVISDHNMLSKQYATTSLANRMFLRASIGTIYPLADARIAVSDGVARDVARLGCLSVDRFTVINNPLPLPNLFERSDTSAVEALWPARPAKRVLSVGRLKPQKNYPLLIRSFKRLLETHDASLMIVGTGELEAELKALTAAESIADRVVFAGHVDDPGPYYWSADIFVLSSDYEGFGNVIVEALAAGLPVVSTDCESGPSDILQRGRFGRLVPVGDTAALAEGMRKSLAEPFDRDAAIARAREFSPQKVSATYLKVLLPGLSTDK